MWNNLMTHCLGWRKIRKVILQIYSSYFSKMASLGFQYEPMSLDVNGVCLEEEQDIPNTHEKSRKFRSVT